MTDVIVLSEKAYARLARDVSKILEDARARAHQAVVREAVQAYWDVGKRLEREPLSERAGHRAVVLERLAIDLAIDVSTLRRAKALHRAFPAGPPEGLGWAHVRELLKLTSPLARERFAALARAEHLTVRQLVVAIREHADDPLLQGVRSGKAKLERPADPTYLYRAEVMKVVDGDTLDLRIDLGFDVDKRHRIRLAGIDAAERPTLDGGAAKRYVEDTLARAQSVVIQTRKFDLHGRYVAHLFYTTAAKEMAEVFAGGRYLNQELLDHGWAVLYSKGGRRKR